MWEGLSVYSLKFREEKLLVQVIGPKFCHWDMEGIQFACFISLPDDVIYCMLDNNTLEVALTPRGTVFKPKVNQFLWSKPRPTALSQTTPPLC